MQTEMPAPRPSGVSLDGAIALCREWMVHLGAADTRVTIGPAREICDLFSGRYLAWVDNSRANLAEDLVIRASHVASSDGRQPIIFKRGGIRPDAQRRADELGVALFSYVAVDGLLEGANPLGYMLRATGLAS